MLSFSLRVPASESPLGSPTEALWIGIPAYTAFLHLFYLSLRVPGKGAASMFANRVPMDRGTPSPELLVYLFIPSFIRSFMSAGIPKKEPSYVCGKT